VVVVVEVGVEVVDVVEAVELVEVDDEVEVDELEEVVVEVEGAVLYVKSMLAIEPYESRAVIT